MIVAINTFLSLFSMATQEVTNLHYGGMILGIAFNHCFCDGTGASQFLHAWAHLCQSTYGLLIPMSYHDRHLLKPHSPPHVAFDHPGFARIAHENLAFQTCPNIFKYLQSQPLPLNKISPDIPEGYYGNAIVMACAKIEVNELVGPNLHDDLSTTMVISQWSKLGLEELDFGHGKPRHMGPLYSDV
ncbi:HXXXD-type acyl-transferase family protein [Striga asiatica]|uniref:HXXXD-type acyl-transferase family protein n=1 Tax=Striga asiatica TaxID=4170 RepID=A0A5A7PS99_STRAF|nr:HXXXD-type acyl-transferase family protein [Striga asiatica]